MNDQLEQIVEAFVKATTMVLGTTCGQVEVAYRRSDGELDCADGNIIGVMGMAGQPGLTTTISVPSKLATGIVSLMSGYDEEDLSRSDVDDGVCEFLNMVCGNAKTWLNRDGFDLALSMPTLIRVASCEFGQHHDCRATGVCFRLLDSSFQLRLSVAGVAVPASS